MGHGLIFAPTRNEIVDLLLDGCKLLMLRPHDYGAREAMARAVATFAVAAEQGDTLLIRALAEEAKANGDELAFRLDSPGYSTLFIEATAARLCQTLTLLRSNWTSYLALVPAILKPQ